MEAVHLRFLSFPLAHCESPCQEFFFYSMLFWQDRYLDRWTVVVSSSVAKQTLLNKTTSQLIAEEVVCIAGGDGGQWK